ncbi:MAG: hypothetical protein ACI9U2_001376 [Bradymonadia bacterium]|jgi:hypothetical protein
MELTLRLQVDPTTQKKQLLVGLQSDADALPMEHEDDHRALVERLMEAGLIGDGVGEVIIDRGDRRAVISVDAGAVTGDDEAVGTAE